MRESLKRGFSTALKLLPFALVGGWFSGTYAFAMYDETAQSQILEQLGSVEVFCVVSAAQAVLYTLVCAVFGRMLAEKCGLWRDESWRAAPLKKTLLLSALGGAFTYGMEKRVFSPRIPAVAASYAGKPDLATWITSLLYGGVVEEVMLRLFVLSLLVFLLWKLFARRAEAAPEWAGIAANIIAALLFAAGHLPVTAQTMGITPLILFRCFLMNGGIGLLLGRLFRKEGIRYSMVCHGGIHAVWKILWTIFG